MRVRDSIVLRCWAITAFVMVCVFLPAFGLGCSFNPAKYMSRNACEVFRIASWTYSTPGERCSTTTTATAS